ncbi:hypothetical protein CLOSTHATH_00289 [Hungatella hathewayi DSM 13479]|uniref:Uncharacterized protein n=1 Tax=Hungatella hathewayi DSM 13479 TaxID=566550 RepID=D3A9L8_9FIRM|nr:hypothetical protein CLOSTHATH_00289 [Hungatella hathewayi DSM 13479]
MKVIVYHFFSAFSILEIRSDSYSRSSQPTVAIFTVICYTLNYKYVCEQYG